MEPAETPAQLFPFRAFKQAIFGTPGSNAGVVDDVEESLVLGRRSSHREQRGFPDSSAVENGVRVGERVDADRSETPTSSPTKGILATPGTASARRKTVSFGAGVVDNERKQGDTVKYAKTPPKPKDGVGVHSVSTSPSDGNGKPPNKLMQDLLDAREESRLKPPSRNGQRPSRDNRDTTMATGSLGEPDDDTANMDEPRSQSGKYWKMEFENYRISTNQEIKMLIRYRRAAKLYAEKKDSEAMRLAEKSRDHEAKVAELERRVSEFASKMLHEEPEVDTERLVQELAKQTALAVQYKHQVRSMRKLLERHGVGYDTEEQEPGKAQEQDDSDKPEDNRKIIQSLDRAKAKIDGMKQEQSDIERLQDVVRSSERKTFTLEKENNALRQTITRYKQEMTKYEDRRKERETKLKQRESKVEARLMDCRERLKQTSHQHRQAEDALRESLSEEHRRMQEEIDEMTMRLSALMEHFPDARLVLNELTNDPPWAMD